jgi:tripartite-type tricarboxylate transporter receptor subunit TctC
MRVSNDGRLRCPRVYMRARYALMLGLLAAGNAAAATAPEASYPVRPIRVLVGFPPGGAADVTVRLIAPKLTEAWGQAIIVDNCLGAGGTTAAEIAAHAAPDGYTLLSIGSSHAASAGLFTKLNYDPANSYAPLGLVAQVPQVLLVYPSLPARNVAELVALAKASPGKLNIASGGSGSVSHLAGELFKSMTRVNIVHVPYKGAPFAMADLITGQVQLMFASLAAGMPQIKSGKLRALGVTSAKRSPAVPEIPTIGEAGVKGYEATGWTGLLAPAGTPQPIVRKVNAGIVAAAKMPDVVNALRSQGAEPETSTPQEFGTYLKSEIAKWTNVIKEAGIRPN